MGEVEPAVEHLRQCGPRRTPPGRLRPGLRPPPPHPVQLPGQPRRPPPGRTGRRHQRPPDPQRGRALQHGHPRLQHIDPLAGPAQRGRQLLPLPHGDGQPVGEPVLPDSGTAVFRFLDLLLEVQYAGPQGPGDQVGEDVLARRPQRRGQALGRYRSPEPVVRRQEFVRAGEHGARAEVGVVERDGAQHLTAPGDQGVQEPVVGEFGRGVPEHDESAPTGPHPLQYGETVGLGAVQSGVRAVREQHQLARLHGAFVSRAQRDAVREVQIGRQVQSTAGGRVDDGRDAVQVGVEQIGQAHHRVLVKTWKPTSFSRKSYGSNRVCRRPRGSSSARYAAVGRCTM